MDALGLILLFPLLGAIMVLFLFVIMLLNLKSVKSEFEKLFSVKILGAGAAILLLFEVVFLIGKGSSMGLPGQASLESIALEGGNTEIIGKLLFTVYLLPFEITSILLIVALIGAVVLAKK